MGCRSFFGYVKRFLMRVLVYFIVVLWPYIKIKKIDANTTEFKSKLEMLFYSLSVPPQSVKSTLEDPSLILFVYSSAEILFGFLGMFGFFFPNIISIILFIVTNIIYFNPYFPENKLSLFDTREEIFLNIGTLVSLMMITFYPYELEYEQSEEKELTIEDVERENERKRKYLEEMPANKKKKRN